MRITTIDTTDQRTAVGYAAAACRIILASLPTATMVELASENCPQEGTTKYDLWNVWADKAAADIDQAGADGQWLWSDVEDHAGRAALPGIDQAAVKMWLGKAGEIDPNVFEPGELAAGAWELLIPKVLQVEADDTVDQLVDLIEESDLTIEDLDELINSASTVEHRYEPDGDDDSEARVRYLVDRLGSQDAATSVEALLAG